MFEDGSTLVYDLPPYEKYPFENSERLDPPLSKAEFFDQYIRDEYEGYAPPDPNAPPYALPQTLEEVTPGCLDDPSCFRGSNLPSSRGAFPGLGTVQHVLRLSMGKEAYFVGQQSPSIDYERARDLGLMNEATFDRAQLDYGQDWNYAGD